MADDKTEKETKEPGNKDFRHLVRIANTDLEGSKKIGVAMKKIKGVGFMLANAACRIANINATKKTGNLSAEDIKKLDEAIKNLTKHGAPSWLLNRRKDPEDGTDKHLLTSDLDFIQENDIKMMKKIKSYRGMRHAYGLPARGQRTKSNFRKSKGKVTGVKRKAGAKSGRP